MYKIYILIMFDIAKKKEEKKKSFKIQNEHSTSKFKTKKPFFGE